MDADKNHQTIASPLSVPLDLSVRGLYGLAVKMLSASAAQWRPLLPVLLVLSVLYGAATMALVALSAATGTPLALLTRDVAATLGAKFYIGLLSNIGALLWCAAATTCFSGAAVLRRFVGQRESAAFLLSSGALMTALGLDDFFMLHEVVYPRLGLQEGVVIVIYALGLLGLTLRYRVVLLGSDLLLWVVGCLLFLMSVLVDGFVPDATAFEDIPKAAGVCTWLCYYWRLAISRVDAEAMPRG